MHLFCLKANFTFLFYLELRKLQNEREEVQQEQVKVMGSATLEKSQNAPAPKLAETSPFKFGNILDKMKNIPKPAEIKDKIQEKLHLDTKKDQPFSKGYVVSETTASQARGATIVSPGEALPPVVQLNSPNLISVEVALPSQSDTADRSEKPVENQTGTGASSALARLQSEHMEDENNEPVYRFGQHAESESDPVNRLSGNTDFEKQKLEDRLSSIDVTVDEGDIVFSRKAKMKHKKKKTSKYYQISGPVLFKQGHVFLN